MVELEQKSQSAPVTIEETTKQTAKDVTEPNQGRPGVELTLKEAARRRRPITWT